MTLIEKKAPIIPRGESDLIKAIDEGRQVRIVLGGDNDKMVLLGLCINTPEDNKNGTDRFAVQDESLFKENDITVYSSPRRTHFYDEGLRLNHLYCNFETLTPEKLGYGWPRFKLEEAGLWKEEI